MKFIATVALVSSALASAIPNEVYISDLNYGGTGCPGGSANIALSEDRQTFTMIYDQFVAHSGPSTPARNNRKNCQINLKMHYPAGFSFAVTSIDYRGFIGIPAGVSAIQTSNFYFSGEVQQSYSSNVFNGPRTEDYLIHDEIESSAIVWSKCGSQESLANIATSVRLQGDLSKAAQVTVDSTDHKVKQIYGIQWKKC